MSSIGERPSDFWTKGSSLYTNAFGYASAPGDREPLRIKGASWFGLESSPCYPGGASKGKIELGMEFLRTHGFNALRLPLAVDAVVEAFRATAAAHLGSCAVESSEADVGGLSPCYTQKYQTARVGDGDSYGEGSFRCLLTQATPHARGNRGARGRGL